MTVTLTVVLVWLASYRATRLVLMDSITDPFRVWLYRWFPPNKEWARYCRSQSYREVDGQTVPRKGKGSRYWGIAETPEAARRRHRSRLGRSRKVSKIGQLFDCPWCIGFWFSGAVVWVTSRYAPIPLPFLVWPAVSTLVGLTAKNLDRS